MRHVRIYTKTHCPYCRRARELLASKGVDYEEIDLLRAPKKRAEMIEAAGGRTTVPQIFIDGRHVGGSDDLYALNERGELDELLSGAPSQPADAT